MRLLLCLSVLLAACGPRSSGSSQPAVSRAPAPRAAAPQLSDADAPIPVGVGDPSWGSSVAPVTLVVFSDFECPFCARAETSLAEVREVYGPDKVRIVWKHDPLPFHPRAQPAAEAAAGVFALGGSGAFWAMHDKVFAGQRDLSQDNLVRWAGESRVEAEAIRRGLEAGTWRGKVAADKELAHAVGVTGTPATFVNGVLVSGAQPAAYFRAQIDEQLEKAEAAQKRGVAPGAMYATLARENWQRPDLAKEEEEEEQVDLTVHRVPVGQSPSRGPADALVTMVVFSDYQCPFCKRFEPTLAAVLAKYPSKVRVVWKDQPLPFHEHARRAAIFAREARAQKGDAGFWAAHDKLFELAPALDKPALEQAAKDLKLTLKKVQDAVKNDKFKAQLDQELELADDVHASGTPHTFVNGRRLVGAQPLEKVLVVVDEELKKAEAKVAAGTPAKDLYETLMKTAKGPEEPERRSVAAPGAAAPSLGPATAKVTLHVFSDFQCPFCARAEATLQELRKTYGDKLRVVARDLPLAMHPDAQLAAEAAREAFAQKGNAGYWKMRDRLFAHQKELSRQQLEEHAAAVGLNLVKFREALDKRSHKAVVEADAAAAEAAKISGTPAFLANEYFVSGAQPLRKFERVVDRALAEAAAPKR